MTSTITEENRAKRREYYAANREAICKYRSEYRARTQNAAIRKYEKTKKGFLMRCYRNMQSRISGVQSKKAHLYAGKELLPREDFYDWSLKNNQFHDLFTTWEQQKYTQKLTPSINRIDSTKGYTLDNMEWLTHSENSRRTLRWQLLHT